MMRFWAGSNGDRQPDDARRIANEALKQIKIEISGILKVTGGMIDESTNNALLELNDALKAQSPLQATRADVLAKEIGQRQALLARAEPVLCRAWVVAEKENLGGTKDDFDDFDDTSLPYETMYKNLNKAEARLAKAYGLARDGKRDYHYRTDIATEDLVKIIRVQADSGDARWDQGNHVFDLHWKELNAHAPEDLTPEKTRSTQFRDLTTMRYAERYYEEKIWAMCSHVVDSESNAETKALMGIVGRGLAQMAEKTQTRLDALHALLGKEADSLDSHATREDIGAMVKTLNCLKDSLALTNKFTLVSQGMAG